MDADFWASRFHSAKQLSALQAARLNHSSDSQLNVDGSEGDDKGRAYFPCPFCYVEIELRVLCSHLQEEHCFDLKNAVCPLCAANLGKDATGHFTLQHSHSIKRRKKSQKSGFSSSTSAVLGKDLRELSSFLGSNSTYGGDVHDSAPDPLLSPFLSNIPLSDPNNAYQEDECSSSNTASTTFDATSTVPAIWDELEQQDYEEKRQRAAFFQQLVLSTIS